MSKNAIIYIRASTKKQMNSLELQEILCRRFASSNGYEVKAVFSEIASGGDSERPGLRSALNQAIGEDIFLIALKVDRIARKVSTIGNIIDRNVKLRIVQFGDTAVNKLLLAVFAAMAETERDLIRQRTVEALRMKKEQGVILGNPNIKSVAVMGRARNSEKALAFNTTTRATINHIKDSGIVTLAGIAIALNARGCKTRRGKKFSSTTVQRILTAA